MIKSNQMDAKTKAIVAHIFFIGWVIALVINMNQKEEYASYYIRQNLGLILLGFALSIISTVPLIGWLIGIIGGIVSFIFWLMSLIWSISGEMKPVPWLGQLFQDWFKAL
ncbi:MAG: hypothetical protein GXY00_02405 [Bacteroidales bacterium]|nr:hypothetical protein [Bacteroidales bacterium]